ncbi:hypothetical protein NDU88_005670 [Pleurodeles waltl]|uniref:Uncharacterized protein n=1 Tax=Pleurodeles waltl TaxID=8319 RepID=A0AAV7SMK5_PLEWA|nr:hypothetical protein NDU88_005670 [Pleurodeles waltl]
MGQKIKLKTESSAVERRTSVAGAQVTSLPTRSEWRHGRGPGKGEKAQRTAEAAGRAVWAPEGVRTKLDTAAGPLTQGTLTMCGAPQTKDEPGGHTRLGSGSARGGSPHRGGQARQGSGKWAPSGPQ